MKPINYSFNNYFSTTTYKSIKNPIKRKTSIKPISKPIILNKYLSKVKIHLLSRIKKRLKKKLIVFTPNVFKSIIHSKYNYRLYTQKNGLVISIYDLIKYFNKKTKRYIKKQKINTYKKYINVSIFKKNPALAYNFYNYLNKPITKLWQPIRSKNRFKLFFSKNNLYQTFNLKQDFPYPNYLQLHSEIQRATIFRDLVNKEDAFYQSIKKNPIVLLISPKPKNIYATIYRMSSNSYNIFWKKSTGMLQKVEGQLSFPALIELVNKINIFLTKQYLVLKNPLKIIIKSSKYYASTNIIQNFVKMFHNNLKINHIYFMYKYKKRFNFFSNYGNLINDSLFNYLSSIWIKFLKAIRRTRIERRDVFSLKQLDAYNKFFGLKFNYSKRQFTIDHYTKIRRLKYFKNKIIKT